MNEHIEELTKTMADAAITATDAKDTLAYTQALKESVEAYKILKDSERADAKQEAEIELDERKWYEKTPRDTFMFVKDVSVKVLEAAATWGPAIIGGIFMLKSVEMKNEANKQIADATMHYQETDVLQTKGLEAVDRINKITD